MLDLLSPAAQTALVKLIDERVVLALQTSQEGDSLSPWLTVSEAAEYLGTTAAAIYKRIGRGQLASYRPAGSRIMLRRTELDAVLDRSRYRSYDLTTVPKRPREVCASGAATPGGMS